MLAITGALFLCIGLAWDPYFPINKKLWTSSFALFADDWSLLLLAAAIYVVDLLRLGRPKLRSGQSESASHPAIYKPLLVFGTNAILAYMISELGDSIVRTIHTSAGIDLKLAAFQTIANVVPHPTWSSLLYSVSFLLLCWLLVLPLYRKRIFLRI
jgi:predicted acyltransferase